MRKQAYKKAMLALGIVLSCAGVRAQETDTLSTPPPVPPPSVTSDSIVAVAVPVTPPLNTDSIRLAKARKDSLAAVLRPKTTAWYLELGGNGLGVSANLERQFGQKDKKAKNVWVAKIGAGYSFRSDTSYVLIPVTIGKIYRQKKYLLEVAVGLAPFFASPSKSGVYVTGLLAYRRNINEGKHFYKLAFTPYVSDLSYSTEKGLEYIIHPWAGIGIGKYF